MNPSTFLHMADLARNKMNLESTPAELATEISQALTDELGNAHGDIETNACNAAFVIERVLRRGCAEVEIKFIPPGMKGCLLDDSTIPV